MVPIRQTVFIWQGIIFCLSFHMKPYLKNIAKNWWTFKTWYLFAIYQFNYMYHHLLSISYLLSHYFWKSINKWRNGGDLKLCFFFLLLLLPTVLISNQCHSIIYWWISKSNSSKESCFEIEYEAYNKIHMWRISIGFLHILMGFLFLFF